MKKALLIVNPKAGTMKIKNSLFQIVDKLGAAEIIPTVAITRYRGHATELAASAHGYDLIICTGGDGTLNEVISGVLEGALNIPIGYIPTGSTNDFASTLGIPTTIGKALNTVINGRSQRIDVGSFNGRYFTDAAFLGALSSTSYETPQDMKNSLGFIAYVLEGIKNLPSLKPIRLSVDADGRHYEGEYLICAVSNSSTLAGVISLDKSIVKMDDGVFELLLADHPKTAAQLASYIHAVRMGDINCEGVTLVSTNSITIKSEDTAPWTLDGEMAQWDGNGEFKVLHEAIEMII